MQIFIHHLTQLTVCDLFCWKCTCFFFFFLNSRRGRLTHGDWICGRIYGVKLYRVQKEAWMWPARSGRLSRSLHSSMMLTLLWPLQGFYDIWPSLQFLLLSSQMESGRAWKHLFFFFIVYLLIQTYVLTDKSYAITSISGAAGCETSSCKHATPKSFIPRLAECSFLLSSAAPTDLIRHSL